MTDFVIKAQESFRLAESLSSMAIFERRRLYFACAEDFYHAAEQVHDRLCKSSLVYLSVSCAQKASYFDSLLQQVGGGEAGQGGGGGDTNSKAGTGGSSKRPLSVSLSGRLSMTASSRGRVTGVRCVPMAGQASDMQLSALTDLLVMEARLGELGLLRHPSSSSLSPGAEAGEGAGGSILIGSPFGALGLGAATKSLSSR